jgi:hypothetical protein
MNKSGSGLELKESKDNPQSLKRFERLEFGPKDDA